MISLLTMVVHTANILGIFTDPFEFNGDYGNEVNSIREKVFELVVSPEALSRNLTDAQIIKSSGLVSPEEIKKYRNQLVLQGISLEKEWGPTLSELIPTDLINLIKLKQKQLETSGFSESELERILLFVEKYQHQNVFHFLRNNPSELLNLDKTLRDTAARQGKAFDLPILGSTQILRGRNSFELKRDLLDAIFTQETLQLAKPQEQLDQSIDKLHANFLTNFLGDEANNQDLKAFTSRGGQLFFFWLYQSLNLHLVAQDPEMIPQINKVKRIFAKTLGNAEARAQEFKDKLLAANSAVLFTQESDAILIDLLTKEGLFLSVDQQNPQDGTLVMLRQDQWEENYEVLTIENYEGFRSGRLNVILATQKETGQQFLLASCHGHSTRSEDGRLQISLIMKKFQELSTTSNHLQLLIGTDANTKTEEDVLLFKSHLDALGLIGTSVGPTTIKQRMVTAQHSKAGKSAVDEEDYLITLKSERGGLFHFGETTVGFNNQPIDTNQSLPNINNPSDHYPVGAQLNPN